MSSIQVGWLTVQPSYNPKSRVTKKFFGGVGSRKGKTNRKKLALSWMWLHDMEIQFSRIFFSKLAETHNVLMVIVMQEM